jgi:hypothetical protein
VLTIGGNKEIQNGYIRLVRSVQGRENQMGSWKKSLKVAGIHSYTARETIDFDSWMWAGV